MKSRSQTEVQIAWSQAWSSLRRSAGRHVFTAAGITLGLGTVATLIQVLAAKSAAGASAQEVDRLRWYCFATGLMCVIGVLNSISISLGQRVREIGTLRCLGASGRLVFLSYGIETIVIAAAGSAVGVLLSIPATAFLTRSSSYSWPIAAICFLASLVVSLIVALGPLLHATKVQAIEAIRVEV